MALQLHSGLYSTEIMHIVFTWSSVLAQHIQSTKWISLVNKIFAAWNMHNIRISNASRLSKYPDRFEYTVSDVMRLIETKAYLFSENPNSRQFIEHTDLGISRARTQEHTLSHAHMRDSRNVHVKYTHYL